MSPLSLNFNSHHSLFYWNKLIQELSSANITFGDYHFIEEGNVIKATGWMFNLSHSPVDYRSKIDNIYACTVQELDEHTAQRRLKADRLQLIALWYAELLSAKKLLSEDNTGRYTHTRFNKLDESNDNKNSAVPTDQSKYQDYYVVIGAITVRMESYLNNMKEIVISASQAELDEAYYQSLDKSISTPNRPFKHFEYLISTDVLKQRKEEFNTGKIFEGDAYVIFNEQTNSYSLQHQDSDTGEWVVKEVAFDQMLQEHISNECQKSGQIISQRISELNDTINISNYLREVLDQIRIMLDMPAAKKGQVEYQIISKELNNWKQLLISKYGNYLREIPSSVRETDVTSAPSHGHIKQQTVHRFNAAGIESFKWKHGPADALNLVLHNELVKNEFIHPNTSIYTLKQAFAGIKLSESLNINWTAKGKNGLANKKLLIYLLDSLASAELIQEDADQKTWIKQIQYVFCDIDNTPFKNLGVSVASKDGKAKTNQQKLIDSIIGKLRQVVSK